MTSKLLYGSESIDLEKPIFLFEKNLTYQVLDVCFNFALHVVLLSEYAHAL